MPKQNVVQKKKIQDHLGEWKTANGRIDIFSTKCKDHRGPLRSVEELDRLAKSYSDKYIYIYIYIYIYFYLVFCPSEHSRFTRQQGKSETIPLSPLYHLH